MLGHRFLDKNAGNSDAKIPTLYECKLKAMSEPSHPNSSARFPGSQKALLANRFLIPELESHERAPDGMPHFQEQKKMERGVGYGTLPQVCYACKT